MSKAHDPSPEQIRQACAEIQAGWSAEERWKRLRVDLRPHYHNIATGERVEMNCESYGQHIGAQMPLNQPDDYDDEPQD